MDRDPNSFPTRQHSPNLTPTSFPSSLNSYPFSPWNGYSYPSSQPPLGTPGTPSFNHYAIDTQHTFYTPLIAANPPVIPHSQPSTLPQTYEFRNTTQTEEQPANSRKRTRNSGSGPSKRRKENERPPAPASASVPSTPARDVAATGVGPAQDVPHTPPSHPLFRSLNSQKPSKGANTNASTDVWYFVQPVPSRSRKDISSNFPTDQILKERPKDADYLACKLCIGEKWSVWKNGHGQVGNIRHHLRTYHTRQYCETVQKNKLKGWATVGEELRNATREEDKDDEGFTLEGFYERLVRWCAATDQSMNIVDSEELRDLLAYTGIGNLVKRDIPHRTRLSKLIVKAFQHKYLELIEEMQRPEAGRVSFTADAWSRSTLEAFLGITAHYMARTSTGRLVLRSRLLAFRHIKGAHTGKNLAERFYEVLDDAKLLGKIGAITMDNASNNDTMMEHLAYLLNVHGIDFDKEANRIRCFPHVINIAVKTGLRHVGHCPMEDTEVTDDEVFDEAFDDWTSNFLSDANDEYTLVSAPDLVFAHPSEFEILGESKTNDFTQKFDSDTFSARSSPTRPTTHRTRTRPLLHNIWGRD